MLLPEDDILGWLTCLDSTATVTAGVIDDPEMVFVSVFVYLFLFFSASPLRSLSLCHFKTLEFIFLLSHINNLRWIVWIQKKRLVSKVFILKTDKRIKY